MRFPQSYRVVRLTSPNLNYFILLGGYLLSMSPFTGMPIYSDDLQVVPITFTVCDKCYSLVYALPLPCRFGYAQTALDMLCCLVPYWLNSGGSTSSFMIHSERLRSKWELPVHCYPICSDWLCLSTESVRLEDVTYDTCHCFHCGGTADNWNSYSSNKTRSFYYTRSRESSTICVYIEDLFFICLSACCWTQSVVLYIHSWQIVIHATWFMTVVLRFMFACLVDLHSPLFLDKWITTQIRSCKVLVRCWFYLDSIPVRLPWAIAKCLPRFSFIEQESHH